MKFHNSIFQQRPTFFASSQNVHFQPEIHRSNCHIFLSTPIVTEPHFESPNPRTTLPIPAKLNPKRATYRGPAPVVCALVFGLWSPARAAGRGWTSRRCWWGFAARHCTGARPGGRIPLALGLRWARVATTRCDRRALRFSNCSRCGCRFGCVRFFSVGGRLWDLIVVVVGSVWMLVLSVFRRGFVMVFVLRI